MGLSGIARFFGNLFSNPIARGIATVALTSFAPQFVPLLNISLRAISAAEGKFGEGNGDKKEEWSVENLTLMAPEIITSIEAATGKQLVDEALFADALKDLVRSLVKMMNAFRLLPKKGAS